MKTLKRILRRTLIYPAMMFVLTLLVPFLWILEEDIKMIFKDVHRELW